MESKKKTYKPTKTTPIHGQGQGSGLARTSWVFNSVTMMKVIEINMKVAKLIRQTKKSMDQTYTLFRRRQEAI